MPIYGFGEDSFAINASKFIVIKLNHYRLVVILSFVSIVTACVVQGKAKTSITEPSRATSTWSVVLSETGGFAGFMRNISIDSNGVIIINDLKTNKSIRKKLNNKTLKKLSERIQAARKLKKKHTINKFTRRCIDCLNYKLSIRWQNKQQLAVLNDINLSKSSYYKIIHLLRGVLDKHYK